MFKNSLLKLLIPSQKQLLTGSMLMIFGSFATSFVNYLYHLIMGRFLEPSNYGILATIISLVGLLNLLPSSLGLIVTKVVSGTKNEEEASKKVSILNKQIMLLGATTFIILLFFSPLMGEFLKISASLLIVGLIIFLLAFPASVYRAILQGFLKFKQMVISQMSENLVRLFGGVALIMAGFSVMGALFGLVLGVLVGWIFSWIFCWNLLQKSTSHSLKTDLKANFKESIPFLLMSISMTSLYSSDLILVKHFFNSFDAGIYAALSFLGRIIFFGVSPITAVMFPIVSKKLSSGEKSLSILGWSIAGALVISLVVTAVYWLFPNLVIGLLYGEKYLSSTYLLGYFAIFITFVTLSFMLLNYELVLGRYRAVFFSTSAAILQIIFIWIFHPTLLSIIIISTLITFSLSVYLLFDIFHLNLKQSLRDKSLKS